MPRIRQCKYMCVCVSVCVCVCVRVCVCYLIILISTRWSSLLGGLGVGDWGWGQVSAAR